MSKAKDIITSLEGYQYFDVIINGKVIETVNTEDSGWTTDEVKKALIDRGYDPRITVRKHKETN